MISKSSGSHQNLRYVFLLSLLLGALGISLFLAVSMGSVQISLSDTYRLQTLSWLNHSLSSITIQRVVVR